ncbi:unnamed protein product [Diamesa hyperborea]
MTDSETPSRDFLLGVVEGFYGRPFTSEQRKELFRKIKNFGMQCYVYAPKDDYKHRGYWRELYTVEEGDHLAGLITAAKEQNIDFYYALSPGLDITYSSVKEIATLKRKLDQVAQFGCENFALLFDDIESEMSKADKEVFQSFAHAQVTISNDIFNHLNCPNFLFCPTQYCGTRAIPNVQQSEYLNTIGQKLAPKIDILWTGPKVISKVLTIESIQEITDVLRRKPLIWDNLHANDYDQKRVFLGPYQGRSPELIPLLRGVVTNPNCEFHANTIAIHTLAQWSRCSSDIPINSSLSDIKLETENDDDEDEPPAYLNESTYHPRVALKNAIQVWLPEFFHDKKAFGPIVKPHPTSVVMAPIPLPIPSIIPSVNTCMSLTLTTDTATTSSAVMPPEINTAQLQALADICSAVTGITECKPVMNSLVSATKVVTTEALPYPIISSSILDIPKSASLPIIDAQFENNEDIEKVSVCDDIPILELTPTINEMNTLDGGIEDEVIEPMDCGSGMVSPKHNSDSSSLNSEATNKKNGNVKNLMDDVIMADTISNSSNMQVETLSDNISDGIIADKSNDITVEDVLLLCDLFYLPFEHGIQALHLLQEFQWLKSNASVLVGNRTGQNSDNPEIQEWYKRSEKMIRMGDGVFELARKIASCANRELCYDLFTYVWEVCAVISIYTAYVKWLSMGHFPANLNSYTQGSYTWFSKGWKETFMSGDQEPWVFRGGLIADLQRLIPVDSGNDLFVYKLPETPTLNLYSIRPYSTMDEPEVFQLCHKTCRDGSDCSDLFPQNLQEIPADRLVAPFLILNPEFCMVVENDNKTLVGYACAALDATFFYRSQEALWLPKMCEKYPMSLLDEPNLSQAAKDTITHFHNFKYDGPVSVLGTHPSIMTCCILRDQLTYDQSVCKRLICVLLATMRSNGSSGVHVCINRTDSYMLQFYSNLGFLELYHDDAISYLGRNF